jgi:hypothetical protein
MKHASTFTIFIADIQPLKWLKWGLFSTSFHWLAEFSSWKLKPQSSKLKRDSKLQAPNIAAGLVSLKSGSWNDFGTWKLAGSNLSLFQTGCWD